MLKVANLFKIKITFPSPNKFGKAEGVLGLNKSEYEGFANSNSELGYVLYVVYLFKNITDTDFR